MPFNGLGPWEILLILLFVLLVFGPRRLPELGGALGKGIREFKRSIQGIRSEITAETEAEPGAEARKELKPSAASSAAAAPEAAAPHREEADPAERQA